MVENVDWDSVISAAAGGSAAVAVFKAFNSKSLNDIEENNKKIEKLLEIIHEHDRKIAVIEHRCVSTKK